MRERVLVYILLCIATIVRFDFLVSSNFRIDSDEAIVGLMAKHILETGEVPVFYYGQHYMGSFEPLMASLSFSLLGVNEFALKMVPLFFSLLFLFLIYRLGSVLVSPAVGKLALLLGAVPPATLVIWSTKARGGFIELVCIGTAAFLATVYWCQNRSERTPYAILVGLLLGFGWWVNNQIIYYMLPVGFVMLGVCLHDERFPLRAVLRTGFLGFAAFLVGGSPYWLYNIEHHFVSFEMFNGAEGTDLFDHVTGFIELAVPILLGGVRFWHTEPLFPGSVYLVWTLAVLSLLIVIRHRLPQFLQLFKFKIEVAKPVEILLLLLFASTVVFLGSSFGYLSQAPRYLLPVYTSVLVLFAMAIVISWKYLRPLSLGLLGCWLLLSGMSGYAGGRAIPGEPFVFKQQRVQADHSELLNWLEARGVSWIRTNYWIGYRISFESNERIRFLIFGEPYQTRIAAYETAGGAYGRARMPLVLVPAQAAYVKTALEAQGYSYSEKELSGYVVLFDIVPGEINLTPIAVASAATSDHPEFTPLALDGSLATRWRSARPQSNEMFFTLTLTEPTTVRGLVYEMGAWPHDYPRELQIELEFADGRKQQLFHPEAYLAVRYFLQGDSTLSFYMDYENVVAIHLLQTGSHDLFDWSIAELRVYQ